MCIWGKSFLTPLFLEIARSLADGRYLLEFGSADAPTYVMRPPSQGDYRAPSAFVLDLRRWSTQQGEDCNERH